MGKYEALFCSTYFMGIQWAGGHDSRGPFKIPPSRDRRHIEWETTPAESAERTVFTFMGGSRVWPAMLPAYPYIYASLTIDGGEPLRFPIGRPEHFRVEREGLVLEFEPRQFHSLAENYHRFFDPAGTAGFFRLHLDGKRLTQGRPVKLRVDLDGAYEGMEVSFHVVPRNDCLKMDLRILRDEVAILQRELVTFKRAHEMLTAQVYPELFPDRIRGERVIVTQDPIKHLHPANVTAMADGELVVTMREGTDHLAREGRMMLVRSKDGGRTWGNREVMFDLGKQDHRASPIVELPNGEWVTTDYRAGVTGGVYDDRDIVKGLETLVGASLFPAWSTDRGRSWTMGKEPLVVPGSPSKFFEIERHMIRLPSGRLIVAGGCMASSDYKFFDGVALFSSDDNGRSWSFLAKMPGDKRIDPEPSILRTKSGKIILLVRTLPGCRMPGDRVPHDWSTSGCHLQTESLDEGKTWSPYRESGLSSIQTPPHLLQLQDGRILATHAARAYPGSIYVTTTSDEGRTWNTAGTKILANDFDNFDNSYPTTCQLKDGSLFTVWYGNLLGKFFIRGMRYRPEEL
jgi:hypothetical protein